MVNLVVKNRSSKISPNGVLTLPLSARKALAMEPGKGCRVTVAMISGGVSLSRSSNQSGIRVSPKGQMELIGDPRALLNQAVARHFWLEISDEQRTVVLYPYTK